MWRRISYDEGRPGKVANVCSRDIGVDLERLASAAGGSGPFPVEQQ